jgi:hypothetical protein
MSDAAESVQIRWHTLAEMYQHYLQRTRSEDFLTAAEILDRLDNQVLLKRVLIDDHPERDAEYRNRVLDDTRALHEQARRMEKITLHVMTQAAVEGHWYAIGRSKDSDDEQFIQPSMWNSLQINVEQGVAFREPSLRFDNVRCALTRELPVSMAIEIYQASRDQELPNTPPGRFVKSPSIVAEALTQKSRTGAPGRPSSMHLIEQQFEQRVTAGQVMPSLSAQANDLHDWFRTQHPERPSPTPATIANRLRLQYKKAKIEATAKPTKL